MMFLRFPIALALSAISAASCALFAAAAFAPSSRTTRTTTTTTTPTTRLYISSWGTKGPPSRAASAKDIEKRIQDYLPEPEAVEARSNIDATITVSGVVNAKERTDQFLFDLLNHQDSAFEFDKIVAFVDDAPFSKKRLLSRSARYTGLLDKLVFTQAETKGSLPTAEQLKGTKTWLAVLEGADLIQQCHQVVHTASSVEGLENVAILLTGASELPAADCQAVVDALESNKNQQQYTVVAVGQLEDHPEGQAAYHFGPFGSSDAVLPATAVFSRQEAYRMVTELLQLESGVNRALAFAEVYNANVTEAKLIKGLREAGYARPQEIDHMIREGPKAYLDAVEKFRTENPDAAKGYTTNAWWEGEEFQKSRQRSDERAAAKIQAIKDERTLEIEAIAKEWVKREYFRQSMAGTVDDDMTEEEFSKTVWDRALLQGDMKYRVGKGEVVDEEGEVATFQSQQERKQKAMLQRAKDELKAIMQEDLNDDDNNDDKKE